MLRNWFLVSGCWFLVISCSGFNLEFRRMKNIFKEIFIRVMQPKTSNKKLATRHQQPATRMNELLKH